MCREQGEGRDERERERATGRHMVGGGASHPRSPPYRPNRPYDEQHGMQERWAKEEGGWGEYARPEFRRCGSLLCSGAQRFGSRPRYHGTAARTAAAAATTTIPHTLCDHTLLLLLLSVTVSLSLTLPLSSRSVCPLSTVPCTPATPRRPAHHIPSGVPPLGPPPPASYTHIHTLSFCFWPPAKHTPTTSTIYNPTHPLPTTLDGYPRHIDTIHPHPHAHAHVPLSSFFWVGPQAYIRYNTHPPFVVVASQSLGAPSIHHHTHPFSIPSPARHQHSTHLPSLATPTSRPPSSTRSIHTLFEDNLSAALSATPPPTSTSVRRPAKPTHPRCSSLLWKREDSHSQPHVRRPPPPPSPCPPDPAQAMK